MQSGRAVLFQRLKAFSLQCARDWTVSAGPKAKDQPWPCLVHDKVHQQSLAVSSSSIFIILTCQDQNHRKTGIVRWAWYGTTLWNSVVLSNSLSLFSLIYKDRANLILAWIPWSASWAAPFSNFNRPRWSMSGFGADIVFWAGSTNRSARLLLDTIPALIWDTALDICFKGLTTLSLLELSTRICLYFCD